MSKRIKILTHQAKFIESKDTHTLLLGGYGAGKSIGGTLKTIERHLTLGVDVAYYLPTYRLIKDIAYKNFPYYLNLMGINYHLNKSDAEIITAFGKIKFRSLENPEYIIGYETGYSCIDEADTMPANKMEDVFIKILGRNRLKLPEGFVNQTDFVSTPEGFGFLYKKFEQEKIGTIIRAKTTDNPFLPDDYIKTLMSLYSPEQVEAYINGRFVNLNKSNVYDFTREKHHTDREVEYKDILHVGIDFNVGNMSAVIHVIDKDVNKAVAEITGVENTFELAEKLKHEYKGHRIAVYPDASGGARKTSATLTDLQILKRAGFIVKAEKKNPPVRERINHLNYLLRNGKYYVNTNKCLKYTQALEQLAYKNGVPDKDSGYDHLTDAGGYFAYKQKRTKFAIR